MGSAKFCTGSEGVKIRYEIRGAGQPLALIMGFSGSSRTWGEPFVQQIEQRWRTILIDNRGTGESDQPDREWSIADMAADVAAVLDDASVARAHVYGISMGGMIAQELVLNHPSRVHGLVLGCTNCGLKNSIPGPPEALEALRPRPDTPLRDQARRALEACCSRPFVESRHGREFIEARLKESEAYPATPLHTYQRQWEAILGFDSLSRLAQIKSPTLVITGGADPIVPAANSDLLQQAIPGSKIHVIDGAGHLFFWEAPEESAEVASDFLARLG